MDRENGQRVRFLSGDEGAIPLQFQHLGTSRSLDLRTRYMVFKCQNNVWETVCRIMVEAVPISSNGDRPFPYHLFLDG